MRKPSPTPLAPPASPKLPQPFVSRWGLGGWRLPILIVLGFISWYVGSSWRAIAPYDPPATLELSGIASPVGISRDDFSIPTIRAQSEQDAYFALGFLHAQDRFWSMEWMRRVAAGRVAEVVGPDGLSSDRFLRTLNLQDAARKSFAKLDADVRTALRSYTAGVNAWLKEEFLPPEFLILNYRPEFWHEEDSLLIAELLALQLMTDWREELLRAQLVLRLGTRANDLWPQSTPDTTRNHALLPLTLASIIPPWAEPQTASNSWAVDGSHTASGKPLLANDTHLRFTEIPILWHLSTVFAPTLAVSGATIPGIPFHLVAHNDRIAWGITVTHADIADLVVEQSSDGQHWQSVDGPKPFQQKEEVIVVKGETDHILTVRNTDHGPVISDLMDERDPLRTHPVISLQTTLFKGNNLSLRALYILNRAADMTSARQALVDVQAPVLNFSLASIDGDIALQTAGQIPLRHPENDGIRPQNGWEDAANWQGFIPYDAMPATVNPASGIVANTNNEVTTVGSQHRINTHWPGEFRARRLSERLEAAPRDMTWEDMAVLQKDTVSVIAQDLLPHLLAAVPAEDPLARLLRGWNGDMAMDRPQPLVFHSWINALWKILVHESSEELSTALHRPRLPALLRILKNPNDWCGNNHCQPQIATALAQATQNLQQRFGKDPQEWRWGDVHKAHLHNSVLERIPLLSSWVNLSFPMGGDDNTLNRGTFAPETYEVIQAANLRAIFDLNDLWQSRFILATGQSGHPISPHYRDQLPLWQNNQTIPLLAPYPRTLLKPKG